ncbi:hypothetical protein [Sulfuricurvum sp.]|uniref:hypothetical protein n=1 Tax=Sulfuricurvum sp. TaxID=2025608 RepID=UPI003567B599
MAKCCEQFMSGWHIKQCDRNATTEYEGNPYCKQHNPELRRMRDEESTRKWNEKREHEKKRKLIEAYWLVIDDLNDCGLLKSSEDTLLNRVDQLKKQLESENG